MLMLRKDAQYILDAVGMDDAHISMCNQYLTPRIVGSCGQVIVVISGITFSKKTLNSSERKYGVELIEKFVRLHEDKFKALVKMKKELVVCKGIALQSNLSLTQHNSTIAVLDGTDNHKSGVSVSLEEVKVDTNVTGYSANDISRLIDHFEKEIIDAKNYLIVRHDIVQLEVKIDELKKEIGRCNI